MSPRVCLVCSRPERSARFYAEALGFEPMPAAEAGATTVTLGETTLLLCPDLPGTPLPYPRGGGVSLCVPVPDLEATYAGAAAHGARVLRAPDDAPPAQGEWHFELADPDGYVLRFVQETVPATGLFARPGQG